MTKKFLVASILALSLLALPAAMACSTTSSSSTPPPSSTSSTPATTPASTASTFQLLANDGGTLFSSTCASCHGANGQGTSVCPVVMWGTGSGLGAYNGQTLFGDAAAMLNWMSTSMPLTAPGSLSSQQYANLLAFILLKAGKVTGSATYNQSQLASIKIP